MNYRNERFGVPSCSALDRLAKCPGSWQLSLEAERQGLVPPAGPEADSGNRIHRWLETGDDADWQALTLAEQDTAERCMRQRDEVVREWGNSLPEGSFLTFGCEFRERRFYFDGQESGKVNDDMQATPIVTGAPDVLILAEGLEDQVHCLIIDYKTGPGAVAHAMENPQLRGLAAIASRFQSRPVKIRVAIIQPLCGPPSVADYGAKELEAALAWLLRVVSASTVRHIDFTKAGDHCQYCPARAICPTLRDTAKEQPLALIQDGLPPDNQQSAMIARALDLDGDDIAHALKQLRLLDFHKAAIKAAARIKLERGEKVGDWELREVEGHRKIEDPEKAAAAVAPLLANAEGGSAAAIMRCASLSAASLTEEIRKASGPRLKKDGTPAKTGYALSEERAKDALADALGDNLTRKKSTKLAEVGKALEDDDDDN